MPNSEPLSRREVRPMRYDQLHSGAPMQWLWDGYLASANITLLTSQWKAGKTTLLAALLHQMKDGGSFAGRAVRAGNAVVLSEEDPQLWHERGRLFDYSQHLWWVCRPFRGKPNKEEFTGLLEQVTALHEEHNISLVVIDSLAAFLPPGSESNADGIVEFIGALRPLTEAGIAVLVLHHPRKNHSGEGQAARGSGALSGAADILIEMHWVGRPSSGDRRRRLKAWSRHKQTPKQLVLELNEAGTVYEVVKLSEEKPPEDDLPPRLREVLEQAGDKLTRHQILDQWPTRRRPSLNLLWRWLTSATEHKLIRREGSGSRYDPYRHWLPEREKEWHENPFWVMAHENFEKWKRERQEKADQFLVIDETNVESY